MQKLIAILILSIALFSCDGNSGNQELLLPGSNGRQNEMLVVVNYQDWEGKIGTALKNVLHSDVLGLPLPEPQFTTQSIDPKNFTGTLQYNRNILRVKVKDSTALIIKHNVSARPQIYMTIQGPNQESIVDLIKKNENKIIRAFKDSDIKAMQKRFDKQAHNNAFKLFAAQGISLSVPTDYYVVKDEDNFIEFRKDFTSGPYNFTGGMHVIAYTLPLEVPFSNIKDSLISIRDNIGEKHLKGLSENSYIITEERYTPHVFDAELAGNKAYRTQGKWLLKNGAEAGPFINYTVEDKANKRLIVVEGLVYAPPLSKRDMMFEVEAIVRSLKIEKN